MPTNMNIVRLSNKLEQIKGDISARIDRARDDNGDPNTELFAIKNPDIEKSMGEWIAERAEEMEKSQKELDDYLKADGALAAVDTLAQVGEQRGIRVPFPTGDKRRNLAGELFGSDEFTEMKEMGAKRMSFQTDIGLKELFASDSNTADTVNVESLRTGEYEMLPRTRVTLLDIIPQLPTTERVVKYDSEVKNLSNVGDIAQGAVYAESEFQIDELTTPVVKVGAFIQTSEELLDDAPETRARIDSNLRGQMLRRIQAIVVGGAPVNAGEYVGTPAASSVDGFLDLTNTTGINFIDAHAGVMSGEKTSEYDLVEQAMEEVYRNGEAESDAIVMTSQSWRNYSTLQSTTGAYIARGALVGTSSPVTREIAGLPVVLCNALPAETVLVGAFREHCAIRDRQDVQVRIQEALSVPGRATSTDVVQTEPTGRFNIYTDARLAFYARRGLAFTKLTNFGTVAP